MNLDKCKPHWWHVYFKQYLILDSYFAVICTGIWLLRHKIIWNYFWSEFFLKFIIIFNKCKVYTWTYMQYSMLPYDMVVYDTLWTLCTEYQYWNFPFEFDFCAAILTFVLVFFFVICSLPFWWKNCRIHVPIWFLKKKNWVICELIHTEKLSRQLKKKSNWNYSHNLKLHSIRYVV